jgi:hypothetical protein
MASPIGALDGKVGDHRRDVLFDNGVARHQEIDDHVYGRTGIVRRNLPDQMEAPRALALMISISHKHFD